MITFLKNTIELQHLFLAFIGSGSGAWVAFRFESSRRKKEEDRRRIEKANIAIYTIFNMWNVLYDYHKKNVVEYKGKDDCWRKMSKTLPMITGLASFDTKGLAFLLSCDMQDVYAKVLIEEQNFGETVNLIEKRNRLLECAERKFESAEIEPGSPPLTDSQIEEIIGMNDVHHLKQYASAIIERVENNIECLKKNHDILRKAMKQLYPKEKFVKCCF